MKGSHYGKGGNKGKSTTNSGGGKPVKLSQGSASRPGSKDKKNPA